MNQMISPEADPLHFLHNKPPSLKEIDCEEYSYSESFSWTFPLYACQGGGGVPSTLQCVLDLSLDDEASRIRRDSDAFSHVSRDSAGNTSKDLNDLDDLDMDDEVPEIVDEICGELCEEEEEYLGEEIVNRRRRRKSFLRSCCPKRRKSNAVLRDGAALPIAKDYIPLGKDDLIAKDVLPLENDIVPLGSNVVLLGNEDVPLGKDILTCGDEFLPSIEKDGVPLENGISAFRNDNVPLVNGISAFGNGNVPLGKDNMPLKMENVPLGDGMIAFGEDVSPLIRKDVVSLDEKDILPFGKEVASLEQEVLRPEKDV